MVWLRTTVVMTLIAAFVTGGGLFVFAQEGVNTALVSDLEQQIQERQREIEELRRRAEQFRDQLEQLEHQKASLQRELALIDGRIQSLQADINVNEATIRSLTLQIQKINNDIAEKEQAMETTRQRMAAIMRTLYRADNETLLEMTLRYKELSEALTTIDFLGQLSDSLVASLHQLRQLKTELEQQRTGARLRRAELTDVRATLTAQRSIIQQQRSQRADVLIQTRGQEAAYQAQLAQSEARQIAIRQEIFDLEDQLRRTLDPSLLPQARPGVLDWPTEGIITQWYGCIHTSFARRYYPSCDGREGGFHNGLDIAAGMGTPLRSARDGTVIASGNAPYAYGQWLAIEHDNGLVTAYTHMSVKRVGVGETVIRGQLVGHMGSTGLSTGPHLHFMVYAPTSFRIEPSSFIGTLPIGLTLNPMDYLSQ